MKSLMRSAALVLAVGLAALVAAPARAALFDARGLWIGTYQSDVDPRVTGPAFLDITMQDQRRFDFDIELVGLSGGTGKGTVSASGEVTFIWFEQGGGSGRGLAHGMVVETSMGTELLVDYRVEHGSGGVENPTFNDQGTIHFVIAIIR